MINLGSYNYLGFSHENGPCADAASVAIDKHGVSVGSTRHEIGEERRVRYREEMNQLQAIIHNRVNWKSALHDI